MMVDAGAVKECDTIGHRLLVQASGTPPASKGSLVAHPQVRAKLGGNLFATKCGLRINPKMQVARWAPLFPGFTLAGTPPEARTARTTSPASPSTACTVMWDYRSSVGTWRSGETAAIFRLAYVSLAPVHRRGAVLHRRMPPAEASSPPEDIIPTKKCSPSMAFLPDEEDVKSSTANILMSELARRPERTPPSAMPKSRFPKKQDSSKGIVELHFPRPLQTIR